MVLATAIEEGYLRFPWRVAAAGEIHTTFSFSPRLEDRRLKPFAVDPSVTTRHHGVTIWNGPSLLLAGTDQTRPTLMAVVDRDGRLRLPQDADGNFRLTVVPNADLVQQDAIPALERGEAVTVCPWDGVRRDVAAAFVFDLVTVPGKNGE